MKILTIAIVLVAVLVLGFVVARVTTNATSVEEQTSSTGSCGACRGSCTAENNCGLASCSATSGTGCCCGAQ